MIPFGPPAGGRRPRPGTSPTSTPALLLVIALATIGVYGLILGGWASNNKFSLMGGLRSAAQMISYEVPQGLSLVGPLMLAGTLSLVGIVESAARACDVWFFVPQIVAFFIYLVAGVAETNRNPFDLPEAESELVAGFHTEYSGMRFALFFLGEYANMIVISAVATTLFLGGWLRPFPNVECARLPRRRAAGPIWFFAQGVRLPVRLHLVPRHVPALPLRPAHGPGLEVDDPAGAGEHPGHRAGQALADLEAADDERRSSDSSTSSCSSTCSRGSGITFKNMFKKKVTVQYPGGALGAGAPLPRHVPARRGPLHQVHHLRRGLPDRHHLHRLAPGGEPGDGKKEKVLDRFDIDVQRCMFCGLCEEGCPTEPKSIWLTTKTYELASYDRW